MLVETASPPQMPAPPPWTARDTPLPNRPPPRHVVRATGAAPENEAPLPQVSPDVSWPRVFPGL